MRQIQLDRCGLVPVLVKSVLLRDFIARVTLFHIRIFLSIRENLYTQASKATWKVRLNLRYLPPAARHCLPAVPSQFPRVVLAQGIIAGFTQVFTHFPAGLPCLRPVLMRLPPAGLPCLTLLFRALRQSVEHPALAIA